MRLFLNRLSVLAKRSLINPAMYVMSAVIILMALLVIFVPEKETSIYIPVAVLNEDSSEDTKNIVDDLCSMNSIFHFYEVDGEDEIYKDLTSGKANTAYSRYDIRQIQTPASSFIFLSREEVFRNFYGYSARQMEVFADHGYEVDAQDPELKRLFGKYMDDQSLFALENIEGRIYDAVTRTEKVPIPLYKFAGFFIFTAALLGTLAFLNDQDNRIYLRFRLIERIYLGLIQVAVFTFPAMIVSVICFLVSRTEFSPLHVIFYTVLVTLLSFVLGTVSCRST